MHLGGKSLVFSHDMLLTHFLVHLDSPFGSVFYLPTGQHLGCPTYAGLGTEFFQKMQTHRYNRICEDIITFFQGICQGVKPCFSGGYCDKLS